jgi:protein gp37
MSKIEWTEETWNPLIGCSKVSPGCKNCYAIQTAWIRQHNPKMAERYAGVVEKTPAGNLNWTGKVNVATDAIDKPLRKKKPTMYFVNSMSDLFHEAVPFEVIDKIYAVMGRCQHHTFQILTKRPDRMLEYYKSDPYQRILNAAYQLRLPKWLSLGSGISNPNKEGNWGWQHVWPGASIENQQTANERIPLLLQVPAAVRFLSCEPLLGPVRLDHIDADSAGHKEYCQINALTGRHTDMARPCADVNKIDWVICGGESGKDARPMHLAWVRSLRDQCSKAGTAFFFKQWGAWAIDNFFTKHPVPGQIWIGNDGVIHKEQPRQMLCFGREVVAMKNVGKNKSGRSLDGREWNEFPGKQQPVPDDPDLHAGGFDY